MGSAPAERRHQPLTPRRLNPQELHLIPSLGFSLYNPMLVNDARRPRPVFVNGCWVSAEARLDNPEEIRRALPGQFRAGSDAELIACAYTQWGTECLQRFEGDFAFALWDTGRRRLFCARDPLGVRPFYYRWHGGRFAWASELTPLLADPEYSRAPDEAMLAEYLLGWSHLPDASATFYRGIRQLPGGHFLLLEDGQLVSQRYWDIDPTDEVRCQRSFEENAEEFGILFAHAVKQRLQGSNPVAVLVSGGLDSTSVASLAERMANGPGSEAPTLFHVCSYFLAPHGDERGYVQRFQEKYGCRVDYLSPKGFRVLENLEEFAGLEEGPFLDLTWSITQQWAGHAKERGCRAALTGFGGDNIFPDIGAPSCADVWQRYGWPAGWQAIRRTASSFGLSPWVLLAPTASLLLPESLKKAAKRWLGRETAPWVRRDFARRSGLLERVRRPLPRRGFSTLSQELDYRHLTSGRLALYVAYLNRVAAAHGLEFRHPFLEPALVRFTVLAPPEHKVSEGKTKLLLRHAMAGILPEAVRQRGDKGGPTGFLATWVRRHEAETWWRLAQSLRFSTDYLTPRAVQGLVKRFLAGDDTALKPAWTLLSTELWLRRIYGALA